MKLYSILYKLQCVFCACPTIHHVLTSLIESLKNTLYNKHFGSRIFIDLQKDFTTVNH